MKKIGIVMGSDSDLPIVEKAINTLVSLEIPYEVHVYSAHRTPKEASEFAQNARKNGFGAIIAAAGMAAHLAGAIAANTTLPVIGIPCKSATLEGLDAARARGHNGGHPTLDPKKVKLALKMYDAKNCTIAEITNATGISKSALYAYVRQRVKA